MSFNNFNNQFNPNMQMPNFQPQNYQGYAGQGYMQPNMMLRQSMNNQNVNASLFNDVKFVNSDEAKGYIPFPNTNNLLIDRTNKIAYLKSADNLGQSSSVMFKYEEINGNGSNLNETKKTDLDLTPYVKKEDLGQFVTQKDLSHFTTKDDLKSLKDKIDKLQKIIKTELLDTEDKETK